MKGARILVLGIALAAGGAAAWLARADRPPAPAPPAAAVNTLEILVAKRDIGVGERLSARDMEWREWLATSANSHVVRKTDRPGAIDQLTGYMTREPIASGDPVRESKLFDARGSGFLAAILPAGMVAYSVEFSADSSAGGNIVANDRVDVIMFHRNPQTPHVSGEPFEQGQTILRNVRVLAIDQRPMGAAAPSDDAGAKQPTKEPWVVGKTATLEVTPQQAESLAMARHQGMLSLALRSLQDSPSFRPAAATAVDSLLATRITIVRFGQGTVNVCIGCDASEQQPYQSAAGTNDQMAQ